MQRITLQDAQAELQQLVDAAVRGETVLIVGDDEQLVQLVPVRSGKSSHPVPGQPVNRPGQYEVITAEHRIRKAGSAAGLVTMAPDFDAPLPDFDEYLS